MAVAVAWLLVVRPPLAVVGAVAREQPLAAAQEPLADGLAVQGPSPVALVAVVRALVWRALVVHYAAPRLDPAPELVRLERVLRSVAALRPFQLAPVVLVLAVVAGAEVVRRVRVVSAARRVREVLRPLVLVAPDVLLHHPPHLLAPPLRQLARARLWGFVLWLHRLVAFRLVCKLQQDALPRVLRLLVAVVRLRLVGS